MSDLFEIEPTHSPRLKWIEKHGIKSKFLPEDLMAYPAHWIVWTGDWDGDLNVEYFDTKSMPGMGDTEEEAITDWAIVNKIKLWNE